MSTLLTSLEANSAEERIDDRLQRLALSFQFAIQTEMDARAISKKQLSRLMGVSQARVSQLLSGDGANLTLKTIAKISEALDADFEVSERKKFLEMWQKANCQVEKSPSNHKAPEGFIRKDFWRDATANRNKFPSEIAA
ncbi:helix-turn-helix transcriptional regulator [Aestuariicoccus sp. MJ-SS9]|uniref:helix-turn-helix domain-containing protein n=1 Tax=Aestuariicoccus sp. MJ-SS9 TaxID=3079855 RepID=UPI00290E66EB|nr:helix-turn-helix transcriptional regulator [Aestuariicoccus sp. MJ-SS9]MDU8912780.1 helix-turn-helix transcriptional regulator [Aestuariicoccus sp. MJ-SS9]